MDQIPPPNVPRLHRCTHPVRHTLGVVGSTTLWLWGSIRMAPYVGAWLGNALAPHSITLSVIITIFANWGWLLLIPFGACVIYVVGMAGCNRALQRIAPRPPQCPRMPESSPQPVMIERVYLASDEAARRGLPGPVIVERIHYQGPRDTTGGSH